MVGLGTVFLHNLQYNNNVLSDSYNISCPCMVPKRSQVFLHLPDRRRTVSDVGAACHQC